MHECRWWLSSHAPIVVSFINTHGDLFPLLPRKTASTAAKLARAISSDLQLFWDPKTDVDVAAKISAFEAVEKKAKANAKHIVNTAIRHRR